MPSVVFPTRINLELWISQRAGRVLGRGSALSQGLYLHRTTQTQTKRRQTSMPRVGSEPTITVFEREKTFHTLDCAATLIGHYHIETPNFN
jgi:hypothetical protein